MTAPELTPEERRRVPTRCVTCGAPDCDIDIPANHTPAGGNGQVDEEVERVGFCTCEPGLPMRDCGIPGHRVVARRLREPAPANSNDVAIEDVRAIAVALGLGGHARPYSAHEVVTREILPALAARRPATEAEAFAHWIVSLDDDDPESPGRQERRTVTLNRIVERARAALSPAAEGAGRG